MNSVAILRRRAEREAFHAASPAVKAELLRAHNQPAYRNEPPARAFSGRPSPGEPDALAPRKQGNA